MQVHSGKYFSQPSPALITAGGAGLHLSKPPQALGLGETVISEDEQRALSTWWTLRRARPLSGLTHLPRGDGSLAPWPQDGGPGGWGSS